MKHFDSNGFVICQECGKSFKTITTQHLRKDHGLTYPEYKSKHDNPPTKMMKNPELKNERDKDLEFLEIKENEFIQDKPMGHFKRLVERKGFDKVEKALTNISNKYTVSRENDIPFNIWLDNILFRINEDISQDEDVEELEEIVVDEDAISLEDSFDSFIRSKFDPQNRLPYQKIEILKYLYNRSNTIENDLLIELYDDPLQRMHRFSFITDIADRSRKEAFFFPDVFWRNEEEVQHPDKYKILEDYGWTIYVFRGTNILDQIQEKF